MSETTILINDESRWLHCLIEGESVVFTVTVGHNVKVVDLKKEIRKELLNTLKGVDPHTLGLWKPKNSNPITAKPSHTLVKRIKSLGDSLSQFSDELEPTDNIFSIFPTQPSNEHLHIIVKVPPTATSSPSSPNKTIKEEVRDLNTCRWLALKNTSLFYTSVDATEGSPTPSPGSVLRLSDSSAMFSILKCDPVSSIYIRACYINWFNRFLEAVAKWPEGKFALSSTPGCGKTFATNFIFKMVTITPSLKEKNILYQFKSRFLFFGPSNVTIIDRHTAAQRAWLSTTFYILDGDNADPVYSECLTLFISSPRRCFKDWHYHAQVTPWYFPVWSLDELHSCRALCYPTLDAKTVSDRYEQYGGVARYVLWNPDNPPPIDAVIADAEARRSIRSVGEPSVMYPTSHMLLHIVVDEDLQYKHITLASRHIGVLLFRKHYEETLDKLQSMLGAGDALASHLFECYGHYLFQYGHD